MGVDRVSCPLQVRVRMKGVIICATNFLFHQCLCIHTRIPDTEYCHVCRCLCYRKHPAKKRPEQPDRTWKRTRILAGRWFCHFFAVNILMLVRVYWFLILYKLFVKCITISNLFLLSFILRYRCLLESKRT